MALMIASSIDNASDRDDIILLQVSYPPSDTDICTGQ
jgi:hypothetical protein